MNLHVPTPSLMPNVCICGDIVQSPVHGFGPAKAVARRTDPETSWEAARSVKNIRASQAEVLALFRACGPMTDEEALDRYEGRQSDSGFRTRRSELVARGLLRDVGTKTGGTGRHMKVWSA